MAQIQCKLTAILAADVHQFSRLMGADEAGTLADLQACRQIIDAIIAEHHGRIFGSAGDSVVAEFASAVSATLCAVECQRAIAARNARPDTRPLQFRIGINIGDVIVEGDNLYGDGVNVAARLESIAHPGSICVSAKVYDEVRRKLSDISFVNGGAQKLKNIEDPVAIYHVGLAGEAARAAAAAAPVAAIPEKPVVVVQAIRLISGDEEVKALTEGLTDAIGDALGHQTALTVKSGGPLGADFVLKGSVQAAGKRLRLSFGLEDGASAAQVWTQRYDRQLDDVFGLQDEIVLHVVAAIRIRVKAQLFERLRGADNATLATPQLLDKAAGIFIRSLDKGGEAVSTLRLAVERAPEHSMARAMLGFGLFRLADYQATAMPDATRDEIVASLDRAVVLDPRSYFARAMKALVLQDLLGDVRGAREQASEALKYNANFIPAKGMLGIAEIHLGKVAEGRRLLQEATEASPDDANQHRHRRELAIAHLLAGDAAEAVRVAARLWEEMPDMKRNALVLAGLLAAAGETEAAKRHVAALKAGTPGLSLETARLPRFGDPSAGERFKTLLREAGLS
ncbi:MAG TPA: adenylate/guanylate cyclase domain-containing protein [Reyranella sp.]|nr:adenylate/guanylate cyclase domain-containing protein [Reyranella sp.]